MLFDKVLRAFETGGFTYRDFHSQLKQILAKGASPIELIETLRRRERIEPLPPYAHEEVLRLLNDAAEQVKAVAQHSDVSVGEVSDEPAVPPESAARAGGASPNVVRQADYDTLARAYERTKDVQTAASERVSALAAALATATRSLEAEQSKTREYGKALAAREADLIAIRQDISTLTLTRQERQQGEPQLLADLQAALAAEQHNVQVLSEKRARESAAAEALQVRLQDALRISARQEAEAGTLRLAVKDRDAKLAGLQQAQADLILGQEAVAASGMQLQADLCAARARADALLLDLNSSRGAAASSAAQLKRTKSDLDAVRNELLAVKGQAHSYFDLLRTREWRRASMQSAALESGQNHGMAGKTEQTLRALNQELQSRLATTKAQLDQRDNYIATLREAQRGRGGWDDGARNDGVRNDGAAIVTAVSTVESAAVEPAAMAFEAKPTNVVEPLSAAIPVSVPHNPFPAARALSLMTVMVLFAVTIWFFTQYGAGRKPVAATLTPGAVPGSVIHDCPNCPAMTVLPAGRFEQGAIAEQSSGAFDKPLHWVTIEHPIGMSMNAVTLDEFQAFVTATGRDMQGCDTYDGAWKHAVAASWKNPGFSQSAAHPVTCVSWNDAQAYAEWISSKAGHRYRLPSASEWEYAARAGSRAAAPWGTAADACANANVADQSAAQRFPGWSVFGCSDGWVYTAPVGSFKANAFGLNDMLGNVFQWTQDCWNADYLGAPIDGSARSDGNCSQRELRGGSWFSDPRYVRANYRNHFAVDYRASSVGIRLVREME